jgi:hypothetical protein
MPTKVLGNILNTKSIILLLTIGLFKLSLAQVILVDAIKIDSIPLHANTGIMPGECYSPDSLSNNSKVYIPADSFIIKDSVVSIDSPVIIKNNSNCCAHDPLWEFHKLKDLFRNEELQFSGKYYVQQSSKGRFKVKLPISLKTKTNLIHSGEGNTSTLSYSDLIPTNLVDGDSIKLNTNIVSWQGEQRLLSFFKHDTASLVNDYNGKILEYHTTKIGRQQSIYQIASSPLDQWKVYSISYYLKNKKNNRYYMITTNIINNDEIPLDVLRYYLNYFYETIESFRIK